MIINIIKSNHQTNMFDGAVGLIARQIIFTFFPKLVNLHKSLNCFPWYRCFKLPAIKIYIFNTGRNTFSCCQDVYYIMDLTVSSKRAVVKPFLRVHKQWKYWVLINCWSKGFFHTPSKNRVKVYFLDMYLFIVLCIVFLNTNDNHTYVIFWPPPLENLTSLFRACQ